MVQLRSLLATLFALAVIGATVFAKDVNDGDEAVNAVASSNLEFANSFYKTVSREKGNVLFSPLSIHTILAMVSQGARGVTEREMSRGLLLPQEKQKIKNGFRKILKSLKATNKKAVTLKIAIKVFTDKRFPIKGEFGKIVRNDYLSQIQTVQFNQSKAARKKINKWVRDNTDQKIKDLLKEGSINSATAMVLVNAVYFKGDWKTKFDPKITIRKPFYVSEEQTKHIPMMVMPKSSPIPYKYFSELDAQILEIPYVGSKESLVIILPNTKTGLANLEGKLGNMYFSNITEGGMPLKRVYLELPRFKVEMAIDLQKPLKELSMRKMFSASADFSGLARGQVLVSRVVTKAYMELSERGTVAAAATGTAVSKTKNAAKGQVTFVADHPFIFCLVSSVTKYDNTKKTVLFMGRYSKP